MTGLQWLAVLFTGSLWGFSFLFTEILLTTFSTYMIVFMRVFISAILLSMYTLYYFRGRIFPQGRLFDLSLSQWLDLCIMALLSCVFPFLCIVYGQTFITGGQASILNSSTAFFSILVASVFFVDETLTKNRLLGILIGTSGVIIAIGYQEIINVSPQSAGGLFVLLGTFCYALAGAWSRFRLQQTPICVSVSVMMIWASVILAVGIGFMGEFQFSYLLGPVFIDVFLYALISTVIAYPLLMYLIRYVGAGNFGISTMATAPSAIILGIIVLGEDVFWHQIIGFLVIVFGLIVVDGRVFKPKSTR